VGRTTDPLRRLTAGQWQPPVARAAGPPVPVSGPIDAPEDVGPAAEAWARHAAAPAGWWPATTRDDRDDGDDGDDELPTGRAAGRLATALTVPLPVLVGAVALVLGAGGWWLWQQVTAPTSATIVGAPVVDASAAPAPASGAGTPRVSGGPADPSGPAAGPLAAAAPAPSASATVHVAGAVGTPGIVVVAPGARVVDAVAAAGGLSEGADVAGVNLARPVADGEMIIVPTPGQAVQAPAGGAAPGPGASTAPARVDINRASPAQLEDLPGIGPVLAQRIAQWREDNGPFASVDDLTAVSGIGPVILEGLRDAATV
jgi:competence protein ComEA